MAKKITNLTGRKFGRLTVLSFYGRKNKSTLWNCKCECGIIKPVIASDMLSGKTVSCGCKRNESMQAIATKHGDHKSKEYRAWKAMKQRCSSYSDSFKRYQGRGIKICQQWIDSYESFLYDIGRAPSARLTVDRINNDGNYEPGNCRWATYKEQANNKSNNV